MLGYSFLGLWETVLVFDRLELWGLGSSLASRMTRSSGVLWEVSEGN